MSELFIGLLSGTSMDGVDAALVDLSAALPTLIHSHRQPIPAALHGQLARCIRAPETVGISQLGQLDVDCGRLFAKAAQTLLEMAGAPPGEVRAIGSHGQTVLHHPGGPTPFSLQLGDPNSIAELTGITTVAGFRGRDLAAGGQGAPLVPAFHAGLFGNPAEQRVVLNLGGIANITILPADPTLPVGGFDTGPGNVLLDAWCQQCRGLPYDNDGAWGASGKVHPALLAALLADCFFQQPPPKSTGRELFNAAWLTEILQSLPGQKPSDTNIQATLVELTAQSVADAIQGYAPQTERVLACGGGVHNQAILRRLRIRLDPCPTESTMQHGFDPDWVEATAFAWLAKQTLNGKPGNIPAVTGARRPVVLGAIYPR